MKLIVCGRLRDFLVSSKSGDYGSKGVLFVVEVLPQVHHLILELNNPFLVELLILQPHLLLHQQDGVEALIVLVVIVEFVG